MTLTEAFIKFDNDKLFSTSKPKTRRNYKSSLSSFLNCWDNIPVELVSAEHVVLWKNHVAQRGKATSSAAADLSRLRAVIKHMKISGYRVMEWEAIERPRVKRKPPVWLTIDEIIKFLSVIKRPRDKAIFAMLFSSGARVSELLNLDRGSITDNCAQITGKGDKPGILRFDDNALAYLDAYLVTRSDHLTPLFVSGQRRRIGVQRVEELAHEYSDQAGISYKNVTPHVFRHSFASDLKLNGKDIYDIKIQMRHERISSTEIYTHISDEKANADYALGHTKVPLV